MEALIILAVLAAIPAKIAQDKGRSPVLWFVYGFFLFLIALIHSLFLKPNSSALGYKKCLYCYEAIPEMASKCKYCGSDV